MTPKTILIFMLVIASVRGLTLPNLICREVLNLVLQDPSIKLDECILHCDGLFNMGNDHGEQMTDKKCEEECDKVINHGVTVCKANGGELTEILDEV